MLRYDAAEFTRIQKTAEGFYTGVARVTRTGVFTYRNADGTLRRELRHPDEVFSLDSLNSLKMIPITNLHPADKLVTAETAKALSIGFTGETVVPDGKYVDIPIKITSADGIAAIETGRQELSCGYEVELDETPGSYDGAEYDVSQRGIKYNHIAIVDRGRAGVNVRLNMDEGDAVKIDDEDPENNPQPSNQRSDRMIKINIDGLEYDAAPEVAKEMARKDAAMAELQTKVDAANKESETLKAKCDTAEETAKQLQTKIDEMPAQLAAATAARVSLVKVATDALDEETIKKLDSMSDKDIKSAVILARFPEAKLDGVSDEYISARFDAAIELKVDNSAMASQRKAASAPRADGAAASASPEAKRKAMMDEMQERYKSGKC